MSSPSMRVKNSVTPPPSLDLGTGPTNNGPPVEYHVAVEMPHRFPVNRLERVRVIISPVQPIEGFIPTSRKSGAPPLPLRLQMPGAIVSPAEQAVEPSPFGSVEASFFVCALAAGSIPGARLEVFRNGVLDAMPLAVRFGSSPWPRRFLILALLVPLLLYLPACWPNAVASGAVSRFVSAWTPSLPKVTEVVTEGAERAYAWLADTGAAFALSFWTLLILLPIAGITWFASRPQPVCVPGPRFALGGVGVVNTPAPMLTPLSDSELGVLKRSEAARLALR